MPLERIIVPFMLTVANGLTSVTISIEIDAFNDGFGTATPPTMFHPCVANRYEPRSV